MFKVTIDNEEVVCNKDFTIKEEMLNTPSVILNNVYPKSWENTKDYVSNFYYPKDYSKCKIFDYESYPALPGETVQGTSLNINYDDTLNFDYKLYGNIEQETTTGKNLFYFQFTNKSANGITATYSNGILTINGTASAQTDILYTGNNFTMIKNTAYTLTSYLVSGSMTGRATYYNQNSTSWQGLTLELGNNETASVTRNTTYTNIDLELNANHFIRIYSGASFNNYKIKFQLEKNNSSTSYEPYTNGPSPNPDYPQEIKTVTGRQEISVSGKNLIQNIFRQGTYNNISDNRRITTQNGVYLKSGQEYTVSISMDTTTYRYIIIGKENNDTTSSNFYSSSWKTNNSFSFTPSQNGYFFVTIAYINENSSSVINPTNSPVNALQLEQGSTATEYEAFKGGSYEINLGKNLFDKDNLQGHFFYNTNTYLPNAENLEWDCSQFIKVNGNTVYTVSMEKTGDTSAYGQVVEWDKNKNGVYSIWNYIENRTFTTKANTEYITIAYKNTNYTNIQLEKGSQATPYSPYKTPIELCKIGTYQDYIYKSNGTWYKHKAIHKITLDNTIPFVYDSTYKYFRNSNYNFGEYLPYVQVNTSNQYCNYFITKPVWSGNNSFRDSIDVNCMYIIANTGYKLAIRNLNYTNDNDFETWLGNVKPEIYYVLATPIEEEITDTELIEQLEAVNLVSGLNIINSSSFYLPAIINLHYNWRNAYDTENLYFCGVVKNTGNISLNPRYPHYCSLQVLDFKTFLSEGKTLDVVITNKTIIQAIEQVVSIIADYGFVVGNVNILSPNDIINAYSTKDKTAYDVFNYIANITQSRWTTRVIDENTIAIDFYDPTLMPSGTEINYTQEFWENNNIIDMTFNYGTYDYRNKQVMTSKEVLANIVSNESIIANGYQTQYNTEQKIGNVISVSVDGIEKTIITSQNKQIGLSADFYYTPGNNYIESNNPLDAGSIINIQYISIVEGRQIIVNSNEIERINSQINRNGSVSRYEVRNDATTSTELQLIGESYIKYKGSPEIKVKVETENNIWNIGQKVQFNAPIEELNTEYMVKSKTINFIATINEIFYTYELTSNFNSESEINYFDNQRAKTIGNIGQGEFISRNVDIENTANIIFYNTTITEATITGDNTLNSVLNSPFIN